MSLGRAGAVRGDVTLPRAVVKLLGVSEFHNVPPPALRGVVIFSDSSIATSTAQVVADTRVVDRGAWALG